MNPYFLATVMAAFFPKVKCPRCQREQLVTKKLLKEGYRCKFCGKVTIPPQNSKK
ncbi:MAG: hypothetical protein ABRQ26_03035 [Syntrophomonadaceae bacterium]